MAKRLILCMDGTSNEVGDRQTHVVRIFRGLRITKTQIPYYVQGVGTLDGQTVAGDAWARVSAIQGLAFGRGLEDDVLEGYRFISRHFDFEAFDKADKRRRAGDPPLKHDSIVLVGFSRGAYAARVLAGFINEFGLLRPNSLHMAAQAFRTYRALALDHDYHGNKRPYALLRRYDQVFDPAHPPIEALVLFDTVASVMNFRRPLENLLKNQSIVEFASHASTRTNPSVAHVLQAISIDERRSFYRPILWEGTEYGGNRFNKETVPQIVRQMWFAGYHSDIGGAAREDRGGLGKISVVWALDQLDQLNIKLDWKQRFRNTDLLGKGTERESYTPDNHRKTGPDFGGPIHNSMRALWPLVEWIPKTLKRRQWAEGRPGFIWYLPRSEPRKLPEGALVHPSVFQRRADGRRAYDPINVAHLTWDDMPKDDPAFFNPDYDTAPSGGGDS